MGGASRKAILLAASKLTQFGFRTPLMAAAAAADISIFTAVLDACLSIFATSETCEVEIVSAKRRVLFTSDHIGQRRFYEYSELPMFPFLRELGCDSFGFMLSVQGPTIGGGGGWSIFAMSKNGKVEVEVASVGIKTPLCVCECSGR